MLTQDDLTQIKHAVVEPLNARIDAVELRLNAKIDGAEQRLHAKIDGVEQHLNAKINASQEEFGGMLHEILNVVSDHHTKLEHRVARIEDHVGLPESR